MDRRRLEPAAGLAKAARRRDRPRERWLLTRKTWKYMADAGRRLIPDGAHNRPEDLPRLEAYFQDVCAREPRFLLWRKSSYPGAAPRPRRKKRPRGGSVRARSPDEPRPYAGHVSGGRLDIAKLRRDFFATPAPRAPSPPSPPPSPPPAEDEEGALVDLLRRYLKLEEEAGPTRASDADELVRAMKRFLGRQSGAPGDADGGAGTQRTLLQNLGRYYERSPNRDNIVQDILTDRSLLKRLYHDLRKTRPYRPSTSRGGGFAAGAAGGARRPAGLALGAGGAAGGAGGAAGGAGGRGPPPLIAVRGASLEERAGRRARGTQTEPVPEAALAAAEREEAASPPPAERSAARRRSSVDHDDVSQSVSDTIKRYLRMARKKSVDADKADRFKRINYDKNLRNIKAKQSLIDDDGLSKGCQTEDGWAAAYRAARAAGSPASPASPTAGGGLLGVLMGRGSPAGGMQKSRSSSSVVQSVSKRLWRTRSRSSSRAAAAWTPQGSCMWTDGGGRCVRLGDAALAALADAERRALQHAALARLQQMNLGVSVRIPDESAAAAAKPKRRAYLLKRKALTTSFFDQRATKDHDKEKEGAGSVFGVPLTQCVCGERGRRGGSRASLASIPRPERGDDSESCDSGEWWSAEEAPRVPALVAACLAHLRRHGLRTLGLFRVSPSKKRVRELREEWERGCESALDAAVCPHDVAALLKEYLRDLPDPLLCRDLYHVFLQTQKIRNRRLQWEALRLVVQLLPIAHLDTLAALLSFLSQLASHSEDGQLPGNKMDAANLATIFAPNILHKNKPNDVASSEQLSERADVINVVRVLIERAGELTALPAELLHDAYIHLAHSAPAHLDALLRRRHDTAAERLSGAGDDEERRVWSREECLHGRAATGGPDRDVPARRNEKSYSRTRRARDTASDTSSGSLSSAMTIVTSRLRSSEDYASSGVVCSPPPHPAHPTHPAHPAHPAHPGHPQHPQHLHHRRDHESRDASDSDYTETLNNSDEDSCVITASLHIPAARPAPRPPRSLSTSESDAKRDSAVGSSSPASPASVSTASSPPASPPPPPARPERAERRDIDRLIALGRERNTSDARAVVLRQHDESSRRETRRETTTTRRGREEPAAPLRHRADPVLYKRGELISSARSPPP